MSSSYSEMTYCSYSSNFRNYAVSMKILPYSLNISREKDFCLALKILSCLQSYLFAIREIFVTKMLKVMNPRKF